MQRQIIIRIAVTTSLVAWATCHVQAEVIFDNLGPDDAFETAGGVPGFGGPLGIQRGLRFTPSSDFLLDSVTAPLIALPGPPNASANPVTLTLYDSDNGLPGNALESTVISELPLIVAPSVSTVEFSGGVSLRAGQEYFIAGSVEEALGGIKGWLSNAVDASGDNVVWSTESGQWEARPKLPSLAARIEGTLVPEPHSAALLIVGLAALSFFRLRRSVIA